MPMEISGPPNVEYGIIPGCTKAVNKIVSLRKVEKNRG